MPIHEHIFDKNSSFEEKCLQVFQFQYSNNTVYRNYVDLLACRVDQVKTLTQIPFLPISFFKTHQVLSHDPKNDMLRFISSGTSSAQNSTHYIYSEQLYQKSILQSLHTMFAPGTWKVCAGLLPSYLEKGNSSLVYMVDHIIKTYPNEKNGFYLYNFKALEEMLCETQENNQQVLLFAVTYAALDFVEQCAHFFDHVNLVVTGGMKGRKKEISTTALLEKLSTCFSKTRIYGEYGMTELLSQAYGAQMQHYICPATMKVFVRDMYDPLHVTESGKGILNIIDLANYYSCSFIASDDLAHVYADGSFTVDGRLDQSDLRGCSLLYT